MEHNGVKEPLIRRQLISNGKLRSSVGRKVVLFEFAILRSSAYAYVRLSVMRTLEGKIAITVLLVICRYRDASTSR